MAGRGIMQRVIELERVGHKFSGYASIDVFEGQTVEEAKADWIAINGPIGEHQIVLWNMGGLNDATA